MTMQTALGVALGFSIILVTMLVIWGFAWATLHFGISPRDFAIGALLGVAALVVALIVVATR